MDSKKDYSGSMGQAGRVGKSIRTSFISSAAIGRDSGAPDVPMTGRRKTSPSRRGLFPCFDNDVENLRIAPKSSMATRNPLGPVLGRPRDRLDDRDGRGLKADDALLSI